MEDDIGIALEDISIEIVEDNNNSEASLLLSLLPDNSHVSLSYNYNLLADNHKVWYQRNHSPAPPPIHFIKQRKRSQSLPLIVDCEKIAIIDDAIPEPDPEPTIVQAGGTKTIQSRLSECLLRNMNLSRQLTQQSKEIERKSLAEIQLHRQLDQLKALHEYRTEMMHKLERRLQLANERTRVTSEGYAKLKECTNKLRVELAKVLKLNLQLTGQASLSDLTVSELESLESTLENGLDQVRQGLRQQYKNAIESNTETCIVCLTEKVSMVFLPCRHRVLCGNCALRVSNCPVDRQEIHDMFPTFGAS